MLSRLCGLFMLAALGAAHSAELRISASPSWPMPYGEFQGERLVGGVVYDIGQALAARLGVTVRWVSLPRKRLDAAAANGEFDVRCYTSPQWTAEPSRYLFTEGLFAIENMIIGRHGVPPITSLDALVDQSVGGVLGFIYPPLAKLEATGRLRRDDAVSQGLVYKKLEAGRTAYAIGETLSLALHLRQAGATNIAGWRYVFDAMSFQCGVLRTSKIDPEKILKAFQALKQDKDIEKILAAYR